MRSLLLPLFVVFAGCTNIPFEDRGQVVQAVFDPATSDVPTPNELATKDGVVAISENPLLSVAENTLKMSLNGRDGFSTASSARVRFTGQLSAASLTDDTVFAVDLGLDGKGAPAKLSLQNRYAECDASLSIVNPAGFTPGHKYLFAVRGGADGAKDAQGNPVVAMPAFHLLRAGKDLTQHLDAMPGKTRAEKQATAEKLEGIRQRFEPYFQVLENNGLPRREVVVLWTFTATKQGEVYFDPGSKRIPFPNELLKDPQTGLVKLPIDPAESEEAKALKRGLSKLDGFSTTAAMTLDTSTAIDRSTVTAGKTVRLFAITADGKAVEKTDITTEISTDGKRLTVRPVLPLRPGTRYTLLLTGVRDVTAKQLSTMPLQQLLALEHALVDEEGNSTISAVCSDMAKRLETLRQTVAPAIEAVGGDRSQLSAAYTFTTQDMEKRVREMYLAPYAANLPLTVTNVESMSPLAAGYALPSVAKVITGKMTTLDFLDPTTRAFRDNGVGVAKQIEFILTLPTGLAQGEKAPVVVFGHGLFTERRLMTMVANSIAMKGMATIAIDFPYHGERTVCMADGDCAGGASCNTDGTCSDGKDLLRTMDCPSFMRVEGACVFSLIGIKGTGKGTPNATGAAFIDVPNLIGSRDHFRQAFVDMSALTRLIKEMDWKSTTGGFGLDGEQINYVGISLGGIIGSSLAGIDPAYKRMVLNVPGAGLVDLMQESASFSGQLEAGLAEKGIVKGTPAFEQFVNTAKWVLDESDPINLSSFALRYPLMYEDPKTSALKQAPLKAIKVQMAVGDTVVPNAATFRLRDVMLTSPSQLREFISPLNHGLLGDPLVAQPDMANFLEGN